MLHLPPNRHRLAQFTPASLPGLAAWYSSDFGVTYDAANAVSSVADRSFNSGRQLAQATGSAQPLLSRPDANGNLFLQSEDFTSSVIWSRDSGLTTTNEAHTNPIGGATSTKVARNNVSASQSIKQNVVGAAGDRLVFEGWVQGDTSTVVDLAMRDVTAAAFLASTPVVLSGPGAFGASGVGNLHRLSGLVAGTWTKVRFTLNAAHTSGNTFTVFCYPDGFTSVTAGQAIYLWGWQIRQIGWGEEYVRTTGFLAYPGLDGKPVIVFNGTAHVLSTAAFPLPQPTTIYLLAQQYTHAVGASIIDGLTANMTRFRMATPSPSVQLLSGGGGAATNDDLPLLRWGTFSAVFSGANSLLQVNNLSPETGNPGANASSGVSLGGNIGAGGNSKILVAELAVFSASHDAPTRVRMNQYLADKWSLPL